MSVPRGPWLVENPEYNDPYVGNQFKQRLPLGSICVVTGYEPGDCVVAAVSCGMYDTARAIAAIPPARDLIRRAIEGLTKGACLTCGAEPGSNIDCQGCKWIVDAEVILRALEGER